MFKLQEYIGESINRFSEWSWQRTANRQNRKRKTQGILAWLRKE